MVREGRGAGVLVLLLVAFPLALGACGGSDSSGSSASSTDGAASGATGPNGATGASGATGAATGATGKHQRDSSGAGKGSGGASVDTGGSSAAGDAPGGTTDKGAAKAPKKTKKPHFLPGAFVGQKKELYDQSRRVCEALTLDGLAHEYDVTPKTPEAVARRYAQAYPNTVRNWVYKGCKAGLTK
jgi:hypothetical protein